MIVVAVLLVVALVVTVTVGAGLLRSERRQHARERDLLLNQLLNVVGKPWQPAPADEPAPSAPEPEREPPRFSTDAEVLSY